MLLDFRAVCLVGKYRNLQLCMLLCVHYRFVNDSGAAYNPRRTIFGPYGSTSVFTGPKVWSLND